MAYSLIQKFVKELNGHTPEVYVGPFSPFMLQLPWSIDTHNPITLLGINKGRQSLFAVDEHNYQLVAERQLRDYLDKKVTLRGLETAYFSYTSVTDSLYEESHAFDLKQMPESDILLFLQKVVDGYCRLIETLYIESFNYDMALKVLGESRKADLDRVWETATHPAFLSFDSRRLGVIVELLKSEEISSLISRVRYIYTDYYSTRPDSDIQAALEEIKSNRETREKEVENSIQSVRQKEKEYKDWLTTLSAEQKSLAEYIQLVIYLRDIRKDPIAKAQVVLVRLASELLSRAGIDAAYCPSLNMFECLRGVEYLKSQRDEIMKRADGNITLTFFDRSIQQELCDYDEAVEEFYALIKPLGDDRVVAGQVANKGRATGTVKVVIDPQESGGFEMGDILVTSMTRPEFVPLMKLAGAVVTNEGGITCHAAIVSRELGIPCVIGTKTATRVLKTGDRVEVDAERGIVTKLS